MKRLLIPALLMLFSIHHLSAATYYASPSGTGNGSSVSEAGSFSTLVKKLTAGDTLYLTSGQYDLGNTRLQNLNGSSSKYIVISGSGKAETILDFRQTAYGTRGLQIASSCSYIQIKDMTLRYSGKNNLYNEGSYCIFENLDVYGSADTGVQMKVGGYNQIINVDSHDNCDYQLGGLTAADFGGNADGFADKQFTGGPNTYIGCRAWNNSDDGWDFFQRITSGTTPTKLINCICYQNGPAYYDFTNHGRYETDKAWFDQFKSAITITDKNGNSHTASLSQYPNLGNGNGFKLGGGYTNNLVQLEHCLSVGNTVKGFDQNNNYGIMTLYNCSAYLNGTDYGFANTEGGTLIIRNCISYKGKNGNSFRIPNLTTDHNSWNTSGISVSNSDFLSLDTTLILSARESDGSLPTVAFMHLQKGSKLIDAGIDVGLTYSGNAPDLGCYEYDNGNIVTPPNNENDPDPDEINIAYVTIPNDSRDNLILTRLRSDSTSFKVYVRDAAYDNDYSAFSLIVISPVPASTAAGLSALKQIDKPTLLLKPFMLKSTVWNWGNSQNTAETSIQVTSPEHPIFKDISLDSGNTLTLFNDVQTNAVTCINSWYNSSVAEIATPVTAVGQTIVEAKAGSSMNGTTISADFLMIGISEYSTAYLTEAATKLIDNACRYLLGINTGTTLTETISTAEPHDDIIYTILGVPVGKSPTLPSTLPAGIYIQNHKTIIITR